MTKRILSILIVLTILCTLLTGQVTFAINNTDSRDTSEIDVTNFDIAQVDAEKVAAVFLLSDIVNNKDSKWDNSCKIDTITPLYDLENNITAYNCKVAKEGKNIGYINVSASSSLNPIIEYSYESTNSTDCMNSLASTDSQDVVDKTYYMGNLEYYVGVKDKNNKLTYKSNHQKKSDKKGISKSFKTTKTFEATNKESWASIKKIDRKAINELFVAGGDPDTYANVISEPITYLKNRFGQNNSYSVFCKKDLTEVGNWRQRDFERTGGVGSTSGKPVNNCTLSSLSNILFYYLANGYNKIPIDGIKIYSSFRQRAMLLGYTPTDGIPVTANDELVGEAWKSFGYSDGYGSNNYLWTFSGIKSLIDNKRPPMLSLASDPYYNHTVAVKGYITYQKGTSMYDFLIVRDNWDYGNRYISDQEVYFGCCTSVVPPTTK